MLVFFRLKLVCETIQLPLQVLDLILLSQHLLFEAFFLIALILFSLPQLLLETF